MEYPSPVQIIRIIVVSSDLHTFKTKYLPNTRQTINWIFPILATSAFWVFWMPLVSNTENNQILNWLTVMKHLRHRWQQIISVCHRHNPILLPSFLTYHLIFNKSNTNGAGNTYCSGVHPQILVGWKCSFCPISCLHIFISVLWCLLRFLHKNYVWFLFTNIHVKHNFHYHLTIAAFNSNSRHLPECCVVNREESHTNFTVNDFLHSRWLN